MIFRDALTYCLKSIGFHKIDLSSYADKTLKAMVRSIQVEENFRIKVFYINNKILFSFFYFIEECRKKHDKSNRNKRLDNE